MTAVIEILSGDLAGRAYDIDEAPFTIGRKDDCAIVIPKRYFSRRHAEIVEEDGRYFVRGLSGKNPIRVDDHEVEEQELEDRVEFEICGVRFRFRARGAKGQNKEERRAEKLASGVQSALPGRAATVVYKKSGGGPDLGPGVGPDDIEDGPLPGESEDEPLPASAKASRAPARKTVKPDAFPEDPDAETEQHGDASGEKGSGAKASGDNASGARASGDKASGVKASGDKASGDKASGDKTSGSKGSGWRPAPDEGPRGRVVFGAESSNDAPSLPKKSQKGSKASGSNDENERTDQLDISKLKGGEADPFADKKETKKGGPDNAAAREKFLRSVSVAGLIFILMAGGVVYYLNKPQPIVAFKYDLKPTCAIGETRVYDENWSENDPPLVSRDTPPDGTPVDIITVADADVARAEWVVPEMSGIAYFLVTGLKDGETSFTVPFSKGNTRTYKITVGGPSRHDSLKRVRTEKLAALASSEELKKAIRTRISQGEELQKLNGGARSERYPRQVKWQYELAQEALEALQKLIDRLGVSDPDLDTIRQDVKTHLDGADKDWRAAIDAKTRSFKDLVARRDYQNGVRELQELLWLIGDTCDVDYKRYELLLTKSYKKANYFSSPSGEFDGPGCIEDRP
jgi:hypothetical protein